MNDSSRLAVVTGGNRGIGLEVCHQLAEAGYRVMVTARDAQDAAEAAEMIGAEGLATLSHQLDVGDRGSVEALAGYLKAEGLVPGILVNSAGVLLDKGWGDRPGSPSAFDADIQDIRDTFEVNVYGLLRMCQALLPGMRDQGWGRVVNVSSGMGQLSDMGGNFPGYRLSKTAVNAVTRIFAAELRDHPNVKINSVCPGWVRTAMGGESATRSTAEGASGIVWAATLPEDGPSGGFFRDGQPIDW